MLKKVPQPLPDQSVAAEDEDTDRLAWWTCFIRQCC